MPETGYIWDLPEGKIGVFVPVINAPIWRNWLNKQDASLREFIPEPKPGYWIFHFALQRQIEKVFITSSWCLSLEKPHFLAPGYVKPKHTGRETSAGNNTTLQGASDPFSVFFVQKNAPKSIVDAAYRTLMKERHPDSSNNDGKPAIALNNARDEIYKLRNW